jgi:hypothetical protein
MANPTTNYGFVMPTSTDLVTDLPADFDVFGQAVDNQMLTNANAAIAKTIVDAKGDIVAATAADTVSRLAVGADDTVLTADSTEATGLKWAAPSSGGMTLLASGTLSGASLDLTAISASYTDLQLQIFNANWATADDYLILRFNGLTTSIYWTMSTGTNNGGGASAFYGAGAASRMLLWSGTNWTRTGSNNINLTIPDYTAAQRRTVYGSIAGAVSGNDSLAYWQGFSTNTGAVDQITFSTNSGYTFSSGTYKLWGVK